MTFAEPRTARSRLALALLLGLALPATARAITPADIAAQWRAIAIAEDRRVDVDGALAAALGSADPSIRQRAVLAVGRIQDSTWVARLLPLLKDPATGVRREAVFALGQIGHRSARVPLEGALPGADPATAQLIVEALGKIGDKASTRRVMSYLGNVSPALRGEAAIALWRLADSTALGSLLARERDPDPGVRWKVQYALEKIVRPDSIVLRSVMHLDDAEWLTRAHAARTLGRQRSTRGTAYLVQKLVDTEPAVVVNAIRAIQMIADTGCATCGPALARALAHPHPYVRVTAATALGDRFAWVPIDSTRRAALYDSLEWHLSDPDAATRGACARSLLARRGHVTPVVRNRMTDSSIYVRTALLQGLASVPLEEARPLLLSRMTRSRPEFERMTAAEVLGTLKDRTQVAALRAGLADSSMLFAASCAGALAAIGDTASVPALTRAYAMRGQDADADARISIRDALRQLAGRAVADSVERAHPQPPLRTEFAPDFAEPPAVKGAVLHTTAGVIEWAFYTEEAPQTVRNFVKLAERGYFNGNFVHRVVPNFVIQDGDPTGSGSGGPGYSIRCEYNQLRYDAGMVGMALSGKDTGGSQWFITHSPQPHLNGRYTIFAHVTKGMDVVHRVVQGDRILKVDILR